MSSSSFYRDPAAAPEVTEATRDKAIAHIKETDSSSRVPASRRFPPFGTYMTASHLLRAEADHLLAAARLQWFQGLTKEQEDDIWSKDQVQIAYYAVFKQFLAMERTGNGIVDGRQFIELPPVYDQTMFKAMAYIADAEKDSAFPRSRRFTPVPEEGAMAYEREAKELLEIARAQWNEGFYWEMEMRCWKNLELFQERYLELFESAFLLVRRDDEFMDELGV